jgi:hypothetical protein
VPIALHMMAISTMQRRRGSRAVGNGVAVENVAGPRHHIFAKSGHRALDHVLSWPWLKFSPAAKTGGAVTFRHPALGSIIPGPKVCRLLAGGLEGTGFEPSVPHGTTEVSRAAHIASA